MFSYWKIFATALVLAGLVQFFVSATAEGSELPCLQCHKSKNSGKIVHPAVQMGCSSCHGTPHREEKPELSLNAEVPGLCFMCHDDSAFRKSSVHTAVAAGMCTSCHDPHSSDNAAMTKASGGELCFLCHDSATFDKATVHPPVAEGSCTFCHSPHSSDNTYNLEYPPGEICLNCHGKEAAEEHVLAEFSPGQRHPLGGRPDPSEKGKDVTCLSCHNPHASDNMKLLSFDRRRADNLCLKCHSRRFIDPL